MPDRRPVRSAPSDGGARRIHSGHPLNRHPFAGKIPKDGQTDRQMSPKAYFIGSLIITLSFLLYPGAHLCPADDLAVLLVLRLLEHLRALDGLHGFTVDGADYSGKQK